MHLLIARSVASFQKEGQHKSQYEQNAFHRSKFSNLLLKFVRNK